jgi:hypothetical protein
MLSNLISFMQALKAIRRFFRRNLMQKERPEKATSSRIYRETAWLSLRPLLTRINLKSEKMQLIYQLLFFLNEEKYRQQAIDLVERKEYYSLHKLKNTIPFDFDEKDYETIQVIYIKQEDQYLLLLVEVNKDYSRKKIIYHKIIDQINYKKYPARNYYFRLISSSRKLSSFPR